MKYDTNNPVIQLEDIPREAIQECAAQGDCDEAVAYWRKKLDFQVDRDLAVRGLRNYGAWDADELAEKSDEDIAEIVLWLACGNFKEQLTWQERHPDKDPRDSDYGSDIFVLGE